MKNDKGSDFLNDPNHKCQVSHQKDHHKPTEKKIQLPHECFSRRKSKAKESVKREAHKA